VLGYIHYVWNDLTAAESHLAALVELRHRANPYTLVAGLHGLTLVHLAQGRPPASSAAAQQLLALAPILRAIDEDVARAFEARLAFLQGDLDLARQWAQTASPVRRNNPTFYFEHPEVTRARILIALGEATMIAEACRVLEDLLAFYSAQHHTPWTIAILAVQALAYQARGATSSALAALQRAVELAAPGGFVRTFLDLGPGLKPLLLQLQRHGVAPAHTADLLAAFAEQSEKPAAPVPPRESGGEWLIEPLTPRELEVLTLLARRRTNKEVARILYISWQTVAKHTVNIYQKLRVANRRDAVRRAQTLGLLPSVESGEQRSDTPHSAITGPW
jgi:LuxR family maltose regulon positive regulatory protein